MAKGWTNTPVARLNRFWGDFYPRIVARVLLPPDQGGIDLKKFKSNPSKVIVEALKELDDKPADVDDLIELVESVEIGILEDEYHFILSNRGIDLPIPGNPNPEHREFDLYGRYSHRTAPAAPIRLPGLQDSGFITFSTLASVSEFGLFATMGGGARGVARSESLLTTPAQFASSPAMPLAVSRFIVNRLDGIIKERDGRGYRWQLNGKIFENLMSVFPNVVAEIWQEEESYELQGIPGRESIRYTDMKTDPHDYWGGLEEIGSCSLPTKMQIDHPRKSGSCEITSDGLVMPVPERPSFETMVKSWVSGEATNPMITYSH